MGTSGPVYDALISLDKLTCWNTGSPDAEEGVGGNKRAADHTEAAKALRKLQSRKNSFDGL
ncbi:hypothetical protein QR685DRAFT_501473 [Neurospora intermedia]|uniref:DRBM domain-containing protein n=1 Tax=Neurospora intermedia TaxID=5142 RepID=A0ABR3D939_NEUIN